MYVFVEGGVDARGFFTGFYWDDGENVCFATVDPGQGDEFFLECANEDIVCEEEIGVEICAIGDGEGGRSGTVSCNGDI